VNGYTEREYPTSPSTVYNGVNVVVQIASAPTRPPDPEEPRKEWHKPRAAARGDRREKKPWQL
jgi:hypothetical protein